jgi:hypothetical protein
MPARTVRPASALSPLRARPLPLFLYFITGQPISTPKPVPPERHRSMTERQERMAVAKDIVTELRTRIAGSFFVPNDEGCSAAVSGFNLCSHRWHGLIVAATTTAADVRTAVAFAGTHSLPVGVVATGHKPFLSEEGFLRITTGALRDVRIDAERRVARVAAGALWSDMVEPAQRAGLGLLHGSTPQVGVTGYTLGGGLSTFLGRPHGWAAGHVVSLEVVTADGALRRVPADSGPELFWGLRGGPSDFGVVTEREIRLFPVTSFYGGGVHYPAEDVEDVLGAFPDVVRDAPDGFICSVALLNIPSIPEVPPADAGAVPRLSSSRSPRLRRRGREDPRALACHGPGRPRHDRPSSLRRVRRGALRPHDADAVRGTGHPSGRSGGDRPADGGSAVTAVEIRYFGGALGERPRCPVQRVGGGRRTAGVGRRRDRRAEGDGSASESMVHGAQVRELHRS